MRQTTPWSDVFDLLHPALGQTLYMVGVATLFATVFGIPLGVLLHVTAPGGLRPVPVLHRILGAVVDFGRSLPFIVLIVLLQQVVTRPLIGTSIGPTAAIVPLAIGAVPFLGRLVQSALREVDATVVEAAVTTGASRTRIVRSVLLGESAPALVSEARALKLLADNGLLKLKPGAETTATPRDVADNTKHLQFVELEAAQLPRSLEDTDASIVNGNYALSAGLDVRNAVLIEKAQGNPNANGLVTRPELAGDKRIRELAELLNSPQVKDYIEQTFHG